MSSAFSLIALETTSLCLYTCSYSQYYFYTLLCVHLPFLLLPPSPLNSTTMYIFPLFFTHTSSYRFKTLSLKCTHKFGTPISTNSITFSSNHFLIFTFFSKLIFLLSIHVSLTTFLIFLVSICFQWRMLISKKPPWFLSYQNKGQLLCHFLPVKMLIFYFPLTFIMYLEHTQAKLW